MFGVFLWYMLYNLFPRPPPAPPRPAPPPPPSLREYGWMQASPYPDTLEEWRSRGGRVVVGEGAPVVDFQHVREALEAGR